MDHWLSAPFDLSKCSPDVRGRRAIHAVASGRRGAERGNGGVSPDLMPRLGVTDWILLLTRCTMCNGLLAQASAAEVVRVPPKRCTINADSPSAQHAARFIGNELTMSGSHGLSQAR